MSRLCSAFVRQAEDEPPRGRNVSFYSFFLLCFNVTIYAETYMLVCRCMCCRYMLLAIMDHVLYVVYI